MGELMTNKRYIVLPSVGLFTTSNDGAGPESFLRGLADDLQNTPANNHTRGVKHHIKVKKNQKESQIRLLDSLAENGAKYIEASDEALRALRMAQPSLRVYPEIFYKPALAPKYKIKHATKKSTSTQATKLRITIVTTNGKPVTGASVVAFTDFAQGFGEQGTTNKSGVVGLSFGTKSKQIERLYVYPEKDAWGLVKKNTKLLDGQELRLTPIAPNDPETALKFFHGSSTDQDGAGVTVGVLDTGVGPHDDLVVDGGLNVVFGEDKDDWKDNGDLHGSHVAGIIGARGTFKGVAPGVTLRSYRVFAKGKSASNFMIIKAIEAAVRDKCDIINLSLGSPAKTRGTKAPS
jgi:subtilisin family serine protease